MNVAPVGHDEKVLHILWMNGGLSCDGESVALTAATQPSLEDLVLGALPGLPRIALHWPFLDFECDLRPGLRARSRPVSRTPAVTREG